MGVEEEGQEAGAEGGVEVDEKRYVISGVVVLKSSVFAYFMFKLKFTLNLLIFQLMVRNS